MENNELKAFTKQNTQVRAGEILRALCDRREIRLFRCTVIGELDANKLLDPEGEYNCDDLSVDRPAFHACLRFEQKIHFNSCKFLENVCFASPWDTPKALKAVFAGDVVFNSSIFCGQALFANATFKQLAGFDGCEFQKVTAFRNSLFESRAMFRTAHFAGYGLFSGARFGGDSRFTNTCFGKGANFSKTKFCTAVDFAGVYAESRAIPIFEDVEFTRKGRGDDETFWRFIKQASQEAGYYRMAGECFYKERCAHLWKKFRGPDDEVERGKRIAVRLLRGLQILPELVFGRLLFGYGERPIRVLIAGAIVIIACGIFYESPLADLSGRLATESGHYSLVDGLYFSVTTFTTVGFGDIHPVETHLLTRFVVMLEAMTGAGLTALFIVALSKRYSRG
ncbi:Ion channel [Anaerohalosphaera lusitana]|uniref:Ion channel n=1 Tax=Anaerohalosphaera lusitana TaxID=1936003 RepID=A0A1U9NN05_9BACT|nr:potassium channel family protein [Anaerohalosphaera lusitana]AQT68990.1 Ion channel [Anaerohalosphaera lusitana]